MWCSWRNLNSVLILGQADYESKTFRSIFNWISVHEEEVLPDMFDLLGHWVWMRSCQFLTRMNRLNIIAVSNFTLKLPPKSCYLVINSISITWYLISSSYLSKHVAFYSLDSRDSQTSTGRINISLQEINLNCQFMWKKNLWKSNFKPTHDIPKYHWIY